MAQIGRIKLKDIRELTAEDSSDQIQQNVDSTALDPEVDCAITAVEAPQTEQTPPGEPVKAKPRKTRAKAKKQEEGAAVDAEVTPTKSVVRRKARTTIKKELDVNQKKIDCFFKSVSKNYKIEPEKLPVTAVSINHLKLSARKGRNVTTGKKVNTTKSKARGRKRLFEDTSSDTATELSLPIASKSMQAAKSKPNTRSRANKRAKDKKAAKALDPEELIDLCSTDSDLDFDMKSSRPKETKVVEKENSAANQNKRKEIATPAEAIAPPMVSIPSNVSATSSEAQLSSNNSSNAGLGALKKRLQQRRLCPDYKVVVGTNFAVDGFNYGQIEGVTHYFLTHFHADHYIGLNRKFSMPLYTSALTARLLRAFIPIDEQYLHELPMNSAVVIDDIEVTAIDANHCPGAIMLVFKLPSGKCILHTGDFRASPAMESEPIFWNNDIDTIYLDTTYLSRKFVFRTQEESIDQAITILESVREKNKHKRLLVVCGSYLIGKEKFWTHLAREFELKVWAEGNRRKALNAMDLYQELLVDDPLEANMHVIPIAKLGYVNLVTHFEQYRQHFDAIVGFRPSGWEKNSRPSYGATFNLIGIEYSEHSGYNELQRFVTFLKPKNVISTVPIGGGDKSKTSAVPTKWYKYDKLTSMHRNYQPSITNYMKFNNPIGDTKESHPVSKNNTVYENLMLVSPNTVVNDSGQRKYPYRGVEEDPSSVALNISSLNQLINDPDLATLGLDTEISEYEDLYQHVLTRASKEQDERPIPSDIKPVVSDTDALDDWMP